MIRRWCLSLVLLVLIGLAPHAASEPAVLEAELALPVRVAGDVAWMPSEATLLAQSSRGTLDWRLLGHITLVEVELWEQTAEGATGPWSPASGVRTTEHSLTDATVSVAERRPGFTSLAWSEGATAEGVVQRVAALPAAESPSWWTAPDLRVFRLGAPLEVSARFSDDGGVMGKVLGRPVPFTHTVAPGALHLQATDATHALEGAMGGYVSEGVLAVRHAAGALRLALHEAMEERAGSVYVPGEGWTGPGTHTERVLRYVQWRTSDARLFLTTTDAPAALYAERVDLVLSGHLGAADAVGSLVFTGADTVATDGATFVASGRLEGTLLPAERSDRARLSASGDVAYVRMGATSSSYAVGAVAGTAIGLALLAALAAAAWKLKEAGLGLVLFSRVARSKALDHEARNEIYAMVKENPGTSAHEVVERLGLGWSTVTYHLGVLERTELVIAHKEGRHRRYFDRTTGQFANGRKKIVSVLKNETTARIAAAVRERPGLVQRRLAEEFGLAPSSVNWHIKRLVEAGLIVKERASRAVALLPGPGWEKLEAIASE